MINLHTDLLDELNGDELAVFCQIIRHIDNEKQCFPSRARLSKLTGFGRDRISNVIKALIQKKIISTTQSKTKGKFSKTIYTILTDKAGIYVSTKNKALHRDTENRNTETPHAGNPTLSINHNISINKYNNITPYQKLLEKMALKLGEDEDYIIGIYQLYKLKEKHLWQIVLKYNSFCLTLGQSKPKEFNHYRNLFNKWIKDKFENGQFAQHTTKRLKGSL
jgi:hypothetical protein